jgi:2',3'-cyclic-nucleotide 2'-phosphodiesterase/3'-nucleotidase
VQAVAITGAQVKEWLEMSAGIFNQVEAGKADQPLINPDFPAYNFDVIDGVTYKIDLSQPPKYDPKGEVLNANSSRIVDLMFDGKPIDPAQKFVVATNNYRAGGGGNFPEINASKDHLRGAGHQPRRDRALHRRPGHDQPVGRRQLVVCPDAGTTVLFETGPKAAAFVGDVKGVKIEAAGEGEGGYARSTGLRFERIKRWIAAGGQLTAADKIGQCYAL